MASALVDVSVVACLDTVLKPYLQRRCFLGIVDFLCHERNKNEDLQISIGTYRAHPLMELKNIEDEHRLCARVLAKLELFNPAGSTKDRVAKAMLDDAEAKGTSFPQAAR